MAYARQVMPRRARVCRVLFGTFAVDAVLALSLSPSVALASGRGAHLADMGGAGYLVDFIRALFEALILGPLILVALVVAVFVVAIALLAVTTTLLTLLKIGLRRRRERKAASQSALDLPAPAPDPVDRD